MAKSPTSRTPSRLCLDARINKVQGQLEAIRRSVADNSDKPSDCTAVIYQIKAARNALKRIGEIYIMHYVDSCISEDTDRDERRAKVDTVMKAIFNS